MGIDINNLSIEEFSKLFPIEIVPYNSKWPVIFEKEKSLLQETLSESIALRIEHFGGTSIPGLSSKPTIDIIMEIPQLNERLRKWIISKMELIDYIPLWRVSDKFSHMMFAKGYFASGFSGQTFHVHMDVKKSSMWDRLYFRNFLRENPETMKAYDTLKQKLADQHKYNRDAYNESKTDFILEITRKAKVEAEKKDKE